MNYGFPMLSAQVTKTNGVIDETLGRFGVAQRDRNQLIVLDAIAYAANVRNLSREMGSTSIWRTASAR